MEFIKSTNKSVLIFIHVALGYVLYLFPFLSTYYAIFIIFIGIFIITNKQDINGYLPLVCSFYILGIEVLLRMTKASLFWEFAKYSVIIFMIFGLLRNKNMITRLPISILIYFIFLLPSIVWVSAESFSLWRQPVAFNLSGPACLLIVSIYCINMQIKKDDLVNLLFYVILPVISMSIFIVLRMPDIDSYRFTPYSNPITSGGYGPNQVSSVYGFAIGSLMLAQIEGRSMTGKKYLDLLLICFFLGLGLITFSRGGILTALIALVFCCTWFYFRNKSKLKMFFNGFIIFVLTVFIWLALVDITGNTINQRYGFGNTKDAKSLLDLTGRALIYRIDLAIFKDNFLTGVGPGGAYDLREKYGYGQKAAAHTEYSRMLAEHGILGSFSLLFLLISSISSVIKVDLDISKHIVLLFLCIALLTMFHSALRLSMPCIAYALIFPRYKS